MVITDNPELLKEESTEKSTEEKSAKKNPESETK